MEHDISETPIPPRARDLSFYVVLFFMVIPLWSSVPLSWAFVIRSLFFENLSAHSFFSRTLFAISACEVGFSIHYLCLVWRVSGPSPHGPGDAAEIRTAFIRLLKTGLANLPEDGGDQESLVVERPGSPEEAIIQLERHDPRAIDFRHSLRTWFCKAPWSTIKLRDVEKWLYWSMFNSELPPPEEVPHAHREIVTEVLELLQKRLGCKLEEGENRHIRPMRLTIDRVNILWRPLTFYAIVRVVNLGFRNLYKTKWSARYASFDGLEYLLRIPEQWDPNSSHRPVVFVHGLGLGLLQYHRLLSHLFESIPDRPILILLQPQISQDFFHPNFLKPLNKQQMVGKLSRLLHKLGWVHLNSTGLVESSSDSEGERQVEKSLIPKTCKGVTMISHSNGSYIHAWMLKEHPKLVTRSCFVDPVTFCSWEGDVCYNFLYRTSKTGIELLMRYFVGTELGVTNLLQRHFDWVSNSLWFEEIPNGRDPSKTLFLLGGKDDIIHAERVKRYLTSHGVQKNLFYDPNGRHGYALLKGQPGHTEILRWLREAQYKGPLSP
jgi:hypothetical protein